MIRFTTGNLLDSGADALVNTVNTVGVMGKGIALMFKEAFPENFRAYQAACGRGEVVVGRMFVTERNAMMGPRWIINFPTKQHWRDPSCLAWVRDGLEDLKRVLVERGIRSIAIPPLGAGNGGLDWAQVRPLIVDALGALDDLDAVVYEPTAAYQNVAKSHGVEALTPARATIAELIRRYGVLGLDCTVLEVQKLAWFIERQADDLGLPRPLDLTFKANRYGPYAENLSHLLDRLDGSYLHCEKRLADAGAFDLIWFDVDRRERLETYLSAKANEPARTIIDRASQVIDGFESPLGMELLATVDWLRRQGTAPTVDAMQQAIGSWPGGAGSAERKRRIFDDRLIGLAIERLGPLPPA